MSQFFQDYLSLSEPVGVSAAGQMPRLSNNSVIIGTYSVETYKKLTHAISLNPYNAESYLLRSQAYKAVNEEAAASEDSSHAASLDKKYANKTNGM